MTKQEAIERRKVQSFGLYKIAQAFEQATIELYRVQGKAPFTRAEKELMIRAEKLGVSAANIARTIALRMDGIR